MINFEPAAPAATNASVGYGAAEQFSHDLPPIASLYAQAAHLTQQGQLAGLDLQQRSQQAATQGQLQDRHIQEQARQAGEQVALGREQLHQRLLENDQHAQNQAWLMQQDLSAKELLMMRQQENAVGEVMANPKLDDQTKNDLVTQIRTHLDPAKARYEQQQARKADQETKMVEAKMGQMAAGQATFEQMKLAAFKSGKSIWTPNGAYGLHGVWTTDDKGMPYQIGTEHPELQAAKKAAAEQKVELERMKADRQEEDAWLKRYDAVEKDLRARAAAKRKAKAEGKADPEPEWDGTNVRGNAEELMRDRGMPGTLAEFRQQQAAGRAKAGGQDAGAGGDYSGGQGQGPPPAGPTPEQVAARKEQVARENPPFEDPAKATPLQRGVLKGFADTTRRMDVLALPEGEAPAARKAMDRAAALVRQYGSFEKMPEADQKFFLEVGEMVKRIDAQVATAEQEKQKFIARQGNRLERGSAALGIPVNPKVR